MVQGVDSQGVYTYIKHFALNDRESNRLSISVWANEQSICEIYLKPFELSVKEGGTTAVMSSRCSPPRNCRTSQISCWPAGRISSR